MENLEELGRKEVGARVRGEGGMQKDKQSGKKGEKYDTQKIDNVENLNNKNKQNTEK